MLALALLLQAASPAAAPITPQGQEMVDLFGSFCNEAALSPAPAHRLLDNQPAIARPMTPDELARVMPDAVATEGWILKSPHDAWGALWFAPSKRTCGVTVQAADPAGMEAALGRRLKTFYDAMGLALVQRPDEVVEESGTTIHRAAWTVTAGSHELLVIASLADKPIGAHQHLMTFTMLR